jgi:sulfide:quinone oxidoreductase
MPGAEPPPSLPTVMPSKHLLVAGGGPAALEGALAVQRLAGERVHVTLLADADTFTYRPLTVAEPFGLGAAQRFSLRALAAERGFAFERGAVAAVEPALHRVRLADGEARTYDALLLAVGARRAAAVPGALTFGDTTDVQRLRTALAGLYAGQPLRVAFVAAADTAWTLPAYELALLTARWADEHGLALEPWLVTHEHRALGVFGDEASRSVTALLEEAGVRLWTGAFAETVEDGRLWLSVEGGLPVDLAVALPRPAGCAIAGLPTDAHGFVPVDALGRVQELADVFAAGDMTARPLKQGGLAAQQADAAATAIAAWAGAPVDPEPYRPVLRGMLLTGERPRYLRRAGGTSLAADDAPWWPPHKIAGRELAPYLTAHPELMADPVEVTS